METRKIDIETARAIREFGYDDQTTSFFVEYTKTKESDNPAFAYKAGEIEIVNSYFSNKEPQQPHFNAYARPTYFQVYTWLCLVKKLSIFVIAIKHPDRVVFRAMGEHPFFTSERMADPNDAFEYCVKKALDYLILTK